MERMKFNEDGSRAAVESPLRRGPLGWFPRLGLNLLAFAASYGSGGGSTTTTASCPFGYQGGGSVGNMKCCGLAQPNNECCYPSGGSKSQYICPTGYNKTSWFCVAGTQSVGCGEFEVAGHELLSGPVGMLDLVGRRQRMTTAAMLGVGLAAAAGFTQLFSP